MAQEPSPNPIATPWHVHPDATHLRVRMEEGFKEFPVVADFAAFFAGNPLSSAGKPAPSGPLPSFQEAVMPPTSPCHVVRILFRRGYWAEHSRAVAGLRRPGLYEIRDPSPSTEKAGQSNTRTHYLLVGNKSQLEVWAQGWQWKLGQPLAGC